MKLQSSDGSPKGRNRKMSFKEKFRRFTSPTTNRKGGDPQSSQQPEVPEVPEVPTSKRTIREKLACALSPESLRKKSLSLSAEGSPQKRKKMAGNSNFEALKATEPASSGIEEDREASPRPQGQGQTEPTCLMPLSPSINFIDAVPSEDNPPAAEGKAQEEENGGKFKPEDTAASSEQKSNRISTTSSTDDEVALATVGVDQLVVAQVHHDPIPEQQEEVPGVPDITGVQGVPGVPVVPGTEQEEIPLPPISPTTVSEPPKGVHNLYKITCRRHKITLLFTSHQLADR